MCRDVYNDDKKTDEDGIIRRERKWGFGKREKKRSKNQTKKRF